ncbi:MAG: short-chain dehydrogenase [Candidatus Pelagibacter sp. TMED128]|nr:MAG: short-chain dehydrogenase [Candidatus Pelagibacter sp. TMED128]|tara:strand:- start:2818 stop:3543 length:726 start_codon:yes stop_codon:yes gene_type:complete
MVKKFLVIGATGAVGSSLVRLFKDDKNIKDQIHLVAKDKNEVSTLSDETGYDYTVADVLETNFLNSMETDLKDVDILGIAYCVGSIDLKPINLITRKDYLKSFEINLFPIVEIIKKFQENLKKNKSSVVLFSTIAVKQGFPNHSIISPVKASLEGLTVSLASELAPNVRVNCIAPSLSNSKMANKMLKNPKISEAIAKQHPLKRLGEGSDSAALAKFLLSKESSWITGQVIGVDGGRSNIG